VTAADDPACGPPGTHAPPGDLRYSYLGWVNEPHLSSPLGYGPSAADPETGRIVMGNAFIYGASVESLSAYARDLVALLNGDLDEDQVLSGDVVDAWVARQEATGGIGGGEGRRHVVDLDGDDAERAARAMDFSWARDLGESRFHAAPPASIPDGVSRISSSLEALSRNGAFGDDAELGAARLAALRGTEIERLMVHEEMRIAAAVDPAAAVDQDVLDQASPLRGMSLDALREVERLRNELQRESCVLYADFAEPSKTRRRWSGMGEPTP